MLELSSKLCFSVKALFSVRWGVAIHTHQLEGHMFSGRRMKGPVNGAHGAFAQGIDECVGADESFLRESQLLLLKSQEKPSFIFYIL